MNQPQAPAQQISIEDAFPVYRQRVTELHDENLLLRSQVAGLQKQISELAKLVPAEADQTRPEPAPGPDLAAVPPYPSDEPA